MINISEAEMSTVQEILRKYAPESEVRVFGSRVKGKIKPYSDLDLAFIEKANMDSDLLMNLREAFQESSLPFRVDLVDYNNASPEFRRIIDRTSVPLVYK